jgi:hypothetical protein
MPKNSAAYMRDYRARKKAAKAISDPTLDAQGEPWATIRATDFREVEAEAETVLHLTAENKRLRADLKALAETFHEEVSRLKRALEARPETTTSVRKQMIYETFPTRDPMREFHPAPKPGQKKGK